MYFVIFSFNVIIFGIIEFSIPSFDTSESSYFVMFITFHRIHSQSRNIFILIVFLFGVLLLQISISKRNNRKCDLEIHSNNVFMDIINS